MSHQGLTELHISTAYSNIMAPFETSIIDADTIPIARKEFWVAILTRGRTVAIDTPAAATSVLSETTSISTPAASAGSGVQDRWMRMMARPTGLQTAPSR
ncbi:hypothetical protein KCV03_g67, partial [Aureobasidium melanogenum]